MRKSGIFSEIKENYKIKVKEIDVNILSSERIEKNSWIKGKYFEQKNNSGKITIEYKDIDQFKLVSDLLIN